MHKKLGLNAKTDACEWRVHICSPEIRPREQRSGMVRALMGALQDLQREMKALRQTRT